MKTGVVVHQKNVCPFCGIALKGKKASQGAKSDEHIISQWLLDHLALRKEPVNSQRVDVSSQSALEHRQFVAGRFVNGRICKTCNNGWMSQLEGDAKPILIRLLDDPHELVRLTQPERNVVALWTVKTAAVLNRTNFTNPSDPLARPMPDRHLQSIRSGTLPDDLIVFGAECPS